MSRNVAAWWIFWISIPTGFWYAFCAAKLWAWFVVPLGAPSLGVVRIAGISCIIGLFRAYEEKAHHRGDDGAELLSDYIVNRVVLIPTILLFFGWLYSHFL